MPTVSPAVATQVDWRLEESVSLSSQSPCGCPGLALGTCREPQEPLFPSFPRQLQAQQAPLCLLLPLCLLPSCQPTPWSEFVSLSHPNVLTLLLTLSLLPSLSQRLLSLESSFTHNWPQMGVQYPSKLFLAISLPLMSKTLLLIMEVAEVPESQSWLLTSLKGL